MKKKLKDNLRKTWKFLLHELKDWQMLVLFLAWYLVFSSPTIVGYVMYFITKNKWHLTYANACILFWAGPGTPELPLCVALAFISRSLLKYGFHPKYIKQVIRYEWKHLEDPNKHALMCV